MLDATGEEQAILLGFSMGVMVILEFWRLFPQRVLGACAASA